MNIVHRGRRGRGCRLPAGPAGLPVLGWLPWLDPAQPYLSLAGLVGRYGKVFTVRLGGILTCVVADTTVWRELLSRQDPTTPLRWFTAVCREDCTGRPPL